MTSVYYTPQGKPLRCFDCDSPDLTTTVTSYDDAGIAESVQVDCADCGIAVGYLENAIWDTSYKNQADTYLYAKKESSEPYYFDDKETFIKMMNLLEHTSLETKRLMSEALSRFSIQSDTEIMWFYTICNVPVPEIYDLTLQESYFNQNTNARELSLFDDYEDVPDVDFEMNRPLSD